MSGYPLLTGAALVTASGVNTYRAYRAASEYRQHVEDAYSSAVVVYAGAKLAKSTIDDYFPTSKRSRPTSEAWEAKPGVRTEFPSSEVPWLDYRRGVVRTGAKRRRRYRK